MRRFGAVLFADEGTVNIEVEWEESGMMYMVVLLAAPRTLGREDGRLLEKVMDDVRTEEV